MPKYRFSSMAVDGALVSSCVKEAESDAEIREIAGNLLTGNQCEAVEVWSSFKLVHRAVRDASHSLPVLDPAAKLPRGSAAL